MTTVGFGGGVVGLTVTQALNRVIGNKKNSNFFITINIKQKQKL